MLGLPKQTHQIEKPKTPQMTTSLKQKAKTLWTPMRRNRFLKSSRQPQAKTPEASCTRKTLRSFSCPPHYTYLLSPKMLLRYETNATQRKALTQMGITGCPPKQLAGVHGESCLEEQTGHPGLKSIISYSNGPCSGFTPDSPGASVSAVRQLFRMRFSTQHFDYNPLMQRRPRFHFLQRMCGHYFWSKRLRISRYD